MRGEYWAIVFAGPRPARFGPSNDLRHVVDEARNAIAEHLKAIVGEPVEGDAPIVVDPQSEITLDELLNLIEVNGGSRKLDFGGCDFHDIDLSRTAIAPRVDGWLEENPNEDPPWLTHGGSVALHEVSLNEARFWGANLRGASLLGARLVKCAIHQTVLDDAILWSTDFTEASIGHGVTFRRAGFSNADLRGVDLFHAHLEGAYWLGAHLDRTRLRAECLGTIGEELAAKGTVPYTIQGMLIHPTFHDAKEAYLLLKTNFASIGRYGDAQWAYVKERQMDKASCFPTAAGHRWIRLQSRRQTRVFSRLYNRFLQRRAPKPLRWLSYQVAACIYHIRLFSGLCPKGVRDAMRAPQDLLRRENVERVNRPRWALNWAYELLTGYGERPILPLLWGAGLAGGFFPLLYWAIGALPGHGAAFTSASPSDIDWAGWGDSVVFSLTSFGTLSFSRLQPEGTLPNLIAAFEAMIGVLLFALFVFTLGNRMSRS